MKQVTGVGNERSLWRLVTTTLCLKSAMLTADLISLETAFPNYTSFKTNVTASRCARSGFSHRSIFDRCKSARRKLHDLVKNRDFIKRTLIRRATAPSSGIFVGDFPENSITCTRRFTPSQVVNGGSTRRKRKKSPTAVPTWQHVLRSGRVGFFQVVATGTRSSLVLCVHYFVQHVRTIQLKLSGQMPFDTEIFRGGINCILKFHRQLHNMRRYTWNFPFFGDFHVFINKLGHYLFKPYQFGWVII